MDRALKSRSFSLFCTFAHGSHRPAERTSVVWRPHSFLSRHHTLVGQQHTSKMRAFTDESLLEKGMAVTERQTLSPLSSDPIKLPSLLQVMFPVRFPTVSAAKNACRRRQVLVDRQIGQTHTLVNPGQTVEYIERTESALPPADSHQLPGLEVVLEDDHVAVVIKPQGLPTQGTGVGAVQGRLKYCLQPSKVVGALRRPIHVHRLDQATGGLLVAAKSRPALQQLSAEFEQHRVKKTYCAIVVGRLEGDGTVDVPLSGKHAVTEFQVIQHTASILHGSITTVLARPHTGRTHQIRRHLAYLGHPIVGDRRYQHHTHGHIPPTCHPHTHTTTGQTHTQHPSTGLCTRNEPAHPGQHVQEETQQPQQPQQPQQQQQAQPPRTQMSSQQPQFTEPGTVDNTPHTPAASQHTRIHHTYTAPPHYPAHDDCRGSTACTQPCDTQFQEQGTAASTVALPDSAAASTLALPDSAAALPHPQVSSPPPPHAFPHTAPPVQEPHHHQSSQPHYHIAAAATIGATAATAAKTAAVATAAAKAAAAAVVAKDATAAMDRGLLEGPEDCEDLEEGGVSGVLEGRMCVLSDGGTVQMCLWSVGVEVRHPVTGGMLSVEIPQPALFGEVRAREEASMQQTRCRVD